MDLEVFLSELQTQISEKNVNFLIGSGASVPFFPSLGNIEKVLTERECNNSVRQLIYLHYFNNVIEKNYDLIDDSVQCEYLVTHNYRRFIRGIVNTMNYRNSRLSPKRANIFTTNYDMFFERAIDYEQRNNSSIILNDGGNGYFFRTLSSENFHKTVSRNGVFDNYHKELPTINLIKCHGSVNWVNQLSGSQEVIEIQNELKFLEIISNSANKITLEEEDKNFIDDFLWKDGNDESLDLKIHEIAEMNWEKLELFFDEYKKLLIINPEKSKFKNTVLDEYYYSMLRLLSYELEKPQTVLIVFGFSFADEHIRNLIKRSFHNPELRIYIFVYKRGSAKGITQLLNCEHQKNVVIIEPTEDMPPIDLLQLNKLLFGG
ncbi:SIR2 family protein [Fictibacillus sp. 18YEL24]|uniref:SIR2 family protein n=1 Tax=Fictibacillus sp. 18YEL24 TaxID=2745875 RepID=UPI0018CF57C9|nr:SIR2 family protein [Fictibacillus sp. 18YEL24]MBH0171647.1 SIR2 family protein [Fictibacillus sp. 18YEL24]